MNNEQNEHLNSVIAKLSEYYMNDLLTLAQHLSEDIAALEQSRGISRANAKKLVRTILDEV